MNRDVRQILLYDTTLRDGAQQEGISLSVEDKLKIARLLDDLGIDQIEGGWPGSNPKDAVFFERAKDLPWHHAKLAAFGSTRRAGCAAEDDANLRALLAADTPVVTVFGKSWRLHVDRVLGTTPWENQRMICDTVRFLREAGREVVFDAEHFFDGFREDAAYAVETLLAAVEAGAASVVLCDTNGGALPWDVDRAVREVRRRISEPIGIHAHNDSGLAVANSLAAVQAGATQVQGTVNGLGERCGNADLCALLPTLKLKLGYECAAADRLRELTAFSETVSEIANCRPNAQRPYVGRSAFAHKGGMHVDALLKCAESYQHVDPERIGNRPRVVVSELSGKANLKGKMAEFGLSLGSHAPEKARQILSQIKDLEHQGFQFEGADASVDLLVRRADPTYVSPFRLDDFHVLTQGHPEGGMRSEAAVKVVVGDEIAHTAADGNGPVNALDAAVRKALVPIYPGLAAIRLTDYKVRILDAEAGTAARIRVLITSSDGCSAWSTVGCGTNVIEASWLALADAWEYALVAAPVGAAERTEA